MPKLSTDKAEKQSSNSGSVFRKSRLRFRNFFRENYPVILIGILYFALALPNINLPAVYIDENIEVIEGYKLIVDPPEDISISAYSEYGLLHIFDRYFPLTTHTLFCGAIEVYLQIPLFLIFGINPFSIRLLPILFGFLILLSTYSLIKSWFSKRVAMFTGILLVSHPAFIFYSRQGHNSEVIFVVSFFWIGLYCINKYFSTEKRNLVYYGLGFFLFGLAYSSKINFLFFIVAMTVTVLLTQWKRFAKEADVKHVALGAVFFLMGSTLTIIQYIKSSWLVPSIMFNCLFSGTPDGISNLSYFNNLLVRIEQFYEVMLQGELWSFYWADILKNEYQRIPGLSGFFNHAFALSFTVALAATPFLARQNNPFRKNRVLFIYSMFVLLLLLTPFTVSTFRPFHLLILYPFPQVILAVFLCSLSGVFNPGRVRIMVYGIIGICLFFNIFLTVTYHCMVYAGTPEKESPWEEYVLSYKEGEGNLFIKSKPKAIKDGFTPPTDNPPLVPFSNNPRFDGYH